MSNLEFLRNVYAQFLQQSTGEPLHGNKFSVRLFDQDPVTDDFLGETKPDAEGKVHFKIDPSLYRSEDNPLEKDPDFYLIVLQEGMEIFRTPVAVDIDFKSDGNFNFNDGEWINLGTFLVEI